MKIRARYLDEGKGIVIILLLLAHTMSGTGVIRTYISSFHMQFFFVVCGILLYRKFGENQVTRGQFASAFRRRVFQLGIPYVVFCLVLAAFYSALKLVSGQELRVAFYLEKVVSLQGIDSLWFLPVYFIAEFIMLAFLCIGNGRKLAVGASVAIIIVLSFFADSMPSQQLLRLLIKSLIGFTFVCLGYELSRLKLFDRIAVPLSITMLVCGAVLSHVNGFAAIGSLELGNGPLFFGDAALTSTAILALLKKAEDNKTDKLKWLSYFGQNTMVILCTNNLLIETVRLLDYKLTGDYLLRSGLAGSVCFTLLLIGMEYGMIRLFSGKLCILVGKMPKTVD